MEDEIENLHIPLIPRDQNQQVENEEKEEQESQTFKSSSIHHEKIKENFESSIKQVEMTVPKTDNPELPVLTFRTWTLGIISCVILSFLNQFFRYRTEPLSITGIAAQIAVVPIGKLMASKLPKGLFFKDTKWEFSLNPGPFNVKEHVLITIFANTGAGAVYAIHVVTGVKIFYKKNISFLVSLLVVITSQVLGFGWAGIFRRYLVEPAEMWWPANLVQVSLFRVLHEKEKRPRGSLTRIQFFINAFTCSSAYYVFPGYLFRMLTSFSWICWAFPKSILAQQLGSGLHGLGIATLGLDWATISSYLGSPLASPWFATANVGVGFFLVMYVFIPIGYWMNIYSAKTFPIFSNRLFTSSGSAYNVSEIMDSNFRFDYDAYAKQGPVYLSVSFVVTYGVGFAMLSATIVHVALFHGRDLWVQSWKSMKEKKMDIHAKLMRRYKEAPEWWFWVMLIVTIVIAIFTCEYYKEQLQLPWWGVLLASFCAFVFTLPIGIITAITNQTPGLNIMSEYIIGYIYPGYPIANMCFKVYGNISMKQAVTFLKDFKLGHYMKIPPRAMFIAQVVGTLISSLVYLTTAWWLMETIPDICESNTSTSVWTCPVDTVFYDASVIWGLIGPHRIFGTEGIYGAINWFFLGGAIAPILVWLGTKAFPNQNWIRLINMPILIGATSSMPPATSVNYATWILVGFLSGYVAFRYAPEWWKRHNYLLSGALDAGLAFMGVVLYLCLGSEPKIGWWGNELDGCPYASCPSEEGVLVLGCPVVH